eukprot:c26625_g1_i1.p1 GENE.c26625_g1_i1~~c26625_g1_i1.p1  ORF type:complete len:190 (-),score=21.77 c26625_g1_i1:71-640(-)
MPATAGRVKMPANNRMYSSAALQTSSIWQDTIGYDPYAPENKDAPTEDAFKNMTEVLNTAKTTLRELHSDKKRGACKKCGLMGHLTYQCMNFITPDEEISSTSSESDEEEPVRATAPAVDKKPSSDISSSRGDKSHKRRRSESPKRKKSHHKRDRSKERSSKSKRRHSESKHKHKREGSSERKKRRSKD